MIQARILPFSDSVRDSTMAKALNKYLNTLPPEQIFNVTIYDKLLANSNPYHLCRIARNSSASVYHNAVMATKKSEAVLHQLESQFVQCFNFGVKRIANPLFAASDRACYGLDISTGNQPKLTTQDEILAFGLIIVDGDAERMTVVGANPMVFPTAVEVADARADLLLKITAESTAKDAFGTTSRAVLAYNIVVDPMIKQIADSGETFYSELLAPAMRVACIEWGNNYVSIGSGSVITFIVLDSITNLPVDLMEGQVNQNGDKGFTNAEGVLVLNTSIVGNAGIKFSKLDPLTGLEMYVAYTYSTHIDDKSNVQYTVHVTKLV